jgi:ABC-type phosphate transport system substrate-binding protein
MNLRTSPLRKMVSVAATASFMASSLVVVAAPAISTAATTCVQEQGSTTVYPALVNAQPAYQGAVVAQPAWPTAQKLGCDSNLVANGSGAGKGALVNYYTGASGTVVDMAASSSPLASGAEANNLMAFQVGGDAMVIAVRNDNPVTQITMAEVTGIYNGEVTTWQQLSNAAGKTGTIIARARIPGSGTRDDMNRLFKMDRGTTQATAPYAKISCSAGFTTCEPDVVDGSGLARITTSQEEADAVCNSNSAIVYTSLANLQLYGPGTAGCDASGHTLKALTLQACDYSTFTGANLNNPLALPCSGAFVAPSVTSAAVSGNYPAKRLLFITLPKVSVAAAKFGTGNGTGWTDNLGLTKAMDIVNYMESTQGQTSVGAVGFIQINVPAKQPIPDADIDLNGGIGLTDIGQITGRWNRTDTIPGSFRADVDNNGGVGLSDIGKITGQWGNTGFVAP